MSSPIPRRPGNSTNQLPGRRSNASLTVRQLANLFFTHGLRGLAKASCHSYRVYLKKFCQQFGNVRVDELKMFDVFTWMGTQKGWKSDSTFATVHKCLKRLFNWGVRFELTNRNPLAALPVPKHSSRRDWKPRELVRIVRNTTPSFRRFVYFMAWTGARPSEVRELKWSDIDWSRCCIVLGKHKTTTTMREPKPRTIVLIPVAVRLLRWIQKHRSYSNTVFLNDHDRPWSVSNVCRRVERIRDKLGLPSDVKPYGIRHFFGTTAVRHGLDIKTLSILMGHESVKMTERYIHLAGDTSHLISAAIQATGIRR